MKISGLKKYKHLSNGYLEVMKSDGIQAVLADYAEEVAQTATSSAKINGAVYEAQGAKVGSKRARGVVTASNYQAKLDNSKYNTLQKSLFGTKG